MLQEFKNTPAMEAAIKNRIKNIIWDDRLGGYRVSEIVFAIFNMGRAGFKLEDITFEAVKKAIDQTAGV